MNDLGRFRLVPRHLSARSDVDRATRAANEVLVEKAKFCANVAQARASLEDARVSALQLPPEKQKELLARLDQMTARLDDESASTCTRKREENK